MVFRKHYENTAPVLSLLADAWTCTHVESLVKALYNLSLVSKTVQSVSYPQEVILPKTCSSLASPSTRWGDGEREHWHPGLEMCISFSILWWCSAFPPHVTELREACRKAATRTFLPLSLHGSGQMHTITQITHRETLRKAGRHYPAHTLALGVNTCRRQLHHTQYHSSLQSYVLETQHYQIPQNLAGFWLCLPTQIATVHQLLAKVLAVPCDSLSLVIQCSSALDPQVACICSSLNGPHSS